MNSFEEIKNELIKQNRIKFLKSKNDKVYLYDAFSQNLFPVTKSVNEFFESEKNTNIDNNEILAICTKLSKWNNKEKECSRLPETHLIINFSNKCNLNCNYCYRHKNNQNVMSLERAFEVLEYANKYFKSNNDEIIFSLDMTAEALLDFEKIEKFDDKLAEYENLYIDDTDLISISASDFLNILKAELYTKNSISFSENVSNDLKQIIFDKKLFSHFSDKAKVDEILSIGNYDPEFLDKKRLLRLNRQLLETFYPNFLKHKDYQQFRIWFMSNGTHITEREIELIKKVRIEPFWISLDGPEEVHNKNRKYYDNRGSYKDVIQNIKLLQDNKINVKISCVLTADYPYPEKLYAYFKTLNVSEIQMCPIRNGNINSFTKDNVNELLNGYKNLFNLFFEEIKNNDFSCFSLLKGDLSMLALINLFQRTKQNGRCTWGDEVVLDSKGDMYPCLYVIGQKKYLLGNIDEKKNSKELLKPLAVTEMDKCETCWARYLCGGTCHYNSIISRNSIYKVDETECQIRKFVITESISFLLSLIENKIDIQKISRYFS